MSLNRSTSSTSVPTTGTCTVPEAMPSPPASSAPSPTSAVGNKGYKFFSNLALAQQPDPDKDDVVWQESDTYAAVVTRKEVSRDSASLLSIRDMLRQRIPTELGASGSKTAPPSTPRSAWAKPDVRLSMEAAGGEVAGLPDTVESAGKFLQELEAVYFVEEPRAESVKTDAGSVSSVSMSSLARRARVPALSAIDVSVGGLHPPMHPPDVPPKDRSLVSTQGSPTPTPGQGGAGKSPPSLANTLTNSLNYALRFMSSGQSTPRGTGLSTKTHHGLLNADGAAIDERPHIKYEAMVGKHLKISCTAYYAKQFDLLRKRCGVDDVFVKSLSRSSNWQVEGGKSRANFWKTRDDRFVIKTLVNAWNVADLWVSLVKLLASAYCDGLL
jgi:1-phosphatidylinositol-3-phosphate 5-kinase